MTMVIKWKWRIHALYGCNHISMQQETGIKCRIESMPSMGNLVGILDSEVNSCMPSALLRRSKGICKNLVEKGYIV